MYTLRHDHVDLPSGGYLSSWLWYVAFVLPSYGDVICATLIFSSAEMILFGNLLRLKL